MIYSWIWSYIIVSDLLGNILLYKRKKKSIFLSNNNSSWGITQAVSANVEGVKTKLGILEEQHRAIEGGRKYGFDDLLGLSLVRDVTIPHKFKVPEFEKYKGTSCSKSHLTMYFRKMVAYAYDDKWLIHFFKDSLARVALTWYTHLEPSRLCSWMDFVDAFLKQYKYNMDIVLDRLQLQNMAKKDVESFKAQGWT